VNTRSLCRDELLKLKGIGPKRAAEIMRLRENSPEPLKHFDDLQKIGLSERQAHAIFNINVVRQVVYPPA
jgi:DNA uptake protein ComE-like DNA-binding protein